MLAVGLVKSGWLNGGGEGGWMASVTKLLVQILSYYVAHT